MDYKQVKKQFVELNSRDLEPDKIKLEYLDLLYNIKRAMCIIGIKDDDSFSVERHSFLCAIIAATIWDLFRTNQVYWGLREEYEEIFMEKNEFIIQCLFHDISETVIGDIPSPIKNDYAKDMENIIYNKINETLKTRHMFDSKTRALKLVDLLSFRYELECYLKLNYKVEDVIKFIDGEIFAIAIDSPVFSGIQEYCLNFLDFKI